MVIFVSLFLYNVSVLSIKEAEGLCYDYGQKEENNRYAGGAYRGEKISRIKGE